MEQNNNGYTMEGALKYLIAYILLAVGVFSAIFWTIQNKDPQAELQSELQFSVVLAAEKNDVLKLFYRKQNEKFNEKSSIEKKINGGNKPYTVNFNVPKDATHLRFDISQNHQQSKMTVDKFSLKRNTKIKAFSSKNLLKKFVPNNYISKANVEDRKVIIETKKIGEKYDPFFNEININELLR